MQYLRIRNWNKYQDVAGIGAPYVKLQTRILLDMDFQMMGDRERLCFFLLLAFAGVNQNKLPADPIYVMHLCHFDDPPDLELMIERGLLEPWSEEKHAQAVEMYEEKKRDQRIRKRKSRESHICHNDVTSDETVTDAMSHIETETETETETERKDKRKSAPRKRGSRLPTYWQPNETLRAWAIAERPDLDIQQTIDSFTDYWQAKPGAAGCKLDWDATFRNWVRNEKTRPQSRTGTVRETNDERRAREADEYRRRILAG